MMIMREERSTPKAVAFEVLLPEQSKNANIPEIAKRLEAENSNMTKISLEDIQMKLQKAEEKRRMSFNQSNSPGFEERLNRVQERKRSLEQNAIDHLNKKVEKDLTLAEQKR
jgi:hypothetical protein